MCRNAGTISYFHLLGKKKTRWHMSFCCFLLKRNLFMCGCFLSHESYESIGRHLFFIFQELEKD
jgi:hypothetical protein